MSAFRLFGTPQTLEIAARWSDDFEARELLPMYEGWSTGDLRITVGHKILTQHDFGGSSRDYLSWYLAPVVEWFIDSWTWLFHEEGYTWVDKSGGSAAIATFSALERYIGSSSEGGRENYRRTQAWWSRHAFRAADASALYPDVFFRRVADDIEISWLDRQPAYPPDGFSLGLLTGCATLPVSAAAEPLWQFIDWATRSAIVNNDDDRQIVESLRRRFEQLRRTPVSELERRHVGDRVFDMLNVIRNSIDLRHGDHKLDHIPAIEYLDPAVLMFGGINVDIDALDIRRILEFVEKQKGVETESLNALVTNPTYEPWIQPYEEGYRLAEDIREALGIDVQQVRIDIRHVLRRLNVSVTEVELDTESIRGVAIAGQGFSPGILINRSSAYNATEAGRRFTLAHEFGHILFDRTRAQRLSHVSGPWTSARTEKRANAFAAMFLASTCALSGTLADSSNGEVRRVASEMGIGFSALVEHLYNVDVIGDAERERLRNA